MAGSGHALQRRVGCTVTPGMIMGPMIMLGRSGALQGLMH